MCIFSLSATADGSMHLVGLQPTIKQKGEKEVNYLRPPSLVRDIFVLMDQNDVDFWVVFSEMFWCPDVKMP